MIDRSGMGSGRRSIYATSMTSSIHPSIHPSIHSSIHSFIDSLIHFYISFTHSTLSSQVITVYECEYVAYDDARPIH